MRYHELIERGFFFKQRFSLLTKSISKMIIGGFTLPQYSVKNNKIIFITAENQNEHLRLLLTVTKSCLVTNRWKP